MVRRDDINSIIERRREKENLREIPSVLVPVWQIKIMERFGINVDREVAEYIVLAAHEKGTWKRQRAIRKLERIFQARGDSREESARKAEEVIRLAVGDMNKE
ncbi:hypothetical protein GCM10007108_14910 [Thermogymnomonas acidicola]|uniref:Uncharacterized protein n=1 Tax=Thermogymnomonas acidicola TaxID=399579 RepID=A0AA37BSE0_9ARCH|nr:hypothetical protein [Thermogymnomonas acidicola]GGM77762.1 hypothetical protein GCM10007108_14910 [Thermogymnomonas acidicola]